jgi:hypothetical protein
MREGAELFARFGLPADPPQIGGCVEPRVRSEEKILNFTIL